MSGHRFTDETATVIVLNSLVRDMHHALEWLAGGLLGFTVYNALRASLDLWDHNWFGLAIHAALATWFGWSFYDTNRRARKYRAGAR